MIDVDWWMVNMWLWVGGEVILDSVWYMGLFVVGWLVGWYGI